LLHVYLWSSSTLVLTISCSKLRATLFSPQDTEQNTRTNAFWNNSCKVYDIYIHYLIISLDDHSKEEEKKKEEKKREKKHCPVNVLAWGVSSHSLSKICRWRHETKMKTSNARGKRPCFRRCNWKQNARALLLNGGCSEVVQGVVEDVGDPRGRREWVVELDMLQHDVEVRKFMFEMNAVDADVGLRVEVSHAFPICDRALRKLHAMCRWNMYAYAVMVWNYNSHAERSYRFSIRSFLQWILLRSSSASAVASRHRPTGKP
jgi:hypothetical protein